MKNEKFRYRLGIDVGVVVGIGAGDFCWGCSVNCCCGFVLRSRLESLLGIFAGGRVNRCWDFLLGS